MEAVHVHFPRCCLSDFMIAMNEMGGEGWRGARVGEGGGGGGGAATAGLIAPRRSDELKSTQRYCLGLLALWEGELGLLPTHWQSIRDLTHPSRDGPGRPLGAAEGAVVLRQS